MFTTDHFKQQPYLSWGCAHYSMYNLFGDERFLHDPDNEANFYRFDEFARSLGYHAWPMYHDATLQFPTPRFWWDIYFNPNVRKDAKGDHTTMLLDIVPHENAQVLHTVGVRFDFGVEHPYHILTTVLDPGQPTPINFIDFAEFKKSKYASAVSVRAVGHKMEIEACFMRVPAHEQSWASPDDVARYTQSLLQDSSHGLS